VKNRRRFTWILLSQNAQVMGFDGTTLQVGFANPGARDSFVGGGSEDVLKQAISDSLGVQWRIESLVDPSGGAGGGAGAAPARQAPVQQPQYHQPQAPQAQPQYAPPPSPVQASAPAARPRDDTPEPPPIEDDIPEDDDPDLDDTALSGHDLFVRELGATVIEEISND
jgi:DNA polymerase-3 subunit gamma/tau